MRKFVPGWLVLSLWAAACDPIVDSSPRAVNNDPDGDGLTSEQEQALGLDPDKADSDDDGLLDGQEWALGTDPLKPDTDGDGYTDAVEIGDGSDPKDPDSVPDLSDNVVVEPPDGGGSGGGGGGSGASEPNTVLLTAPDEKSKETSVEFTFDSNLTDTTFECRLDGNTFNACDTPKVYSGIAEGDHVFEVRAVSDGLKDQSPASYAFTIDRTAPQLLDLVLPLPVTNVAAPIEFALSETGQAECTLVFFPTGFALPQQSSGTCDSPFDWDRGEGNYSLQINTVDDLGNELPVPFPWNWVLDQTPPVVDIESSPTGTIYMTPARVQFATDEVGALTYCTVTVNMVAGEPQLCLNPLDITDETIGFYSVAITAVDPAGNVGNPAYTGTWRYEPDLDAPVCLDCFDLTELYAPFVSSVTVDIALNPVDVNDPVEVLFTQGVANPVTWVRSDTLAQLTLTAGDGNKWIEFSLRDPVGNVSGPFGVSVTVDTGAPGCSPCLSSNFGNLVSAYTVAFTFDVSDATPVQMRVGGHVVGAGSWQSFSSARNLVFPSADSQYTATVEYRDAAHNTSGPYAYALTIDTTAPAVPALSATAASRSVDLQWTSSPGASAYLLEARKGSSGAFTAYTSAGTSPITLTSTQVTLTGLTNGDTWHFRVRARDQVGNRSGYSSTQIVVPVPAAPVAVTGFATELSVHLAWQPVTHAQGYRVYYGYSSGSTSGTGLALNSPFDVTMAQLTLGLGSQAHAGVPTWFRVVARENGVSSAYSASVKLVPESWEASSLGAIGGEWTALLDLTGDGVREWAQLAVSGPVARLSIHHGATQAVLGFAELDYAGPATALAIACVDCLDGRGRLLATGFSQSRSGTGDGEVLLWDIQHFTPHFWNAITSGESQAYGFGKPLLPAGDVDGDGYDEFWVAATRATTVNGILSGKIYAVSTASGDSVLELDGPVPSGYAGRALYVIDDISGDGVSDLVASASIFGTPSFVVIDGMTTALIAGYFGDATASTFFGSVVLSRDMAVIVSDPGYDNGDGMVWVSDGAALVELMRGGGGLSGVGIDLALGGDWDFDGIDDLYVAIADCGGGQGCWRAISSSGMSIDDLPAVGSSAGLARRFMPDSLLRGQQWLVQLGNALWRYRTSQATAQPWSAVPDSSRDAFQMEAASAQLEYSAIGSVVGSGVYQPGVGTQLWDTLTYSWSDGRNMYARPVSVQAPRVAQFLSIGSSGAEQGMAMAMLPDLDADGVAEVAIGSPGFGSKAGRIKFIRASDGMDSTVAPVDGAASARWGHALVRVTDVSGDGVPDLVVGSAGTGTALGTVSLLDSSTMTSIWNFTPDSTNATNTEFGASVHFVPELGALIVARPLVGEVWALDPGTGDEVWHSSNLGSTGAYPNSVARAVVVVPDRNSDGVWDLAVGVWKSSPAKVVILSGASGVVLQTINDLVGSNTGFGLGLLPVYPGAGASPDLLVGAPLATASAGAVAQVTLAGSLQQTLTASSSRELGTALWPVCDARQSARVEAGSPARSGNTGAVYWLDFAAPSVPSYFALESDDGGTFRLGSVRVCPVLAADSIVYGSDRAVSTGALHLEMTSSVAPPAPTSAQFAAAVAGGSVSLAWTAVAGASGYEVVGWRNGQGPQTLATVGNVTGTVLGPYPADTSLQMAVRPILPGSSRGALSRILGVSIP